MHRLDSLCYGLASKVNPRNPLNLRILLSFCLLVFLFQIAEAKPWRGIEPLHSTRSDVRKLLGKPIFETRINDTYDSTEGRVTILYARQACEEGRPADWGNWNVPAETVVNIQITLETAIPVRSLKIQNLRRYKWYTDSGGATYYRLRGTGLEYQVQARKVTGITYGPARKDARLLCRKNVPEMRY